MLRPACLTALTLLLLPPLIQAQSLQPTQKISYEIRCALDDKSHTLEGQLRVSYKNTSPDTLRFLWFMLGPNAYRNDRTAYTDQSLAFDSLSFYFSRPDQRGYINRLNFRIDRQAAVMFDDRQHQDLMKVMLPVPLAPGDSCQIETPFFVKIPANFSGFGHRNGRYEMAGWHPMLALFADGEWHPRPSMMTGDIHLPFADFHLRLDLPSGFGVVSSLGEVFEPPSNDTGSNKTRRLIDITVTGTTQLVWLAARDFTIFRDTVVMPDGDKLFVKLCLLPEEAARSAKWQSCLRSSLLHHARYLGSIPGGGFTLASTYVDAAGSGSYPGLATFRPSGNSASDSIALSESVASAWLQALVSFNRYESPWLLNGLSAWLAGVHNPNTPTRVAADKGIIARYFSSRLPTNERLFALQAASSERRLPSFYKADNLEWSGALYDAATAVGPAIGWQQIASKIGTDSMAGILQRYFRTNRALPVHSGRFITDMGTLTGTDVLSQPHLFADSGQARALKRGGLNVKPLFGTDVNRTIYYAPALGYNRYDGFMLGGSIHNYGLPGQGVRYFLAPLFGVGSKSINGIADLRWNQPSGNGGRHWEYSLSAASFHADQFTDSNGRINRLRFSKLVPGVRYFFQRTPAHPKRMLWIEWKTFLIREQSIQFERDTLNNVDLISYPSGNRYVNRLEAVMENSRGLYPYRYALRADQGKNFLRLAFTGNYFFNYASGDGLRLRCFAGKFLYLGSRNNLTRFETDAYHLNMTGPKGYEDYTYENYFAGRNDFDGWASQQIMERDGFLKVRTDLLSSKVGKTDNWLAAINLTTPLPRKLNPLSVLPVRLFLDIGTCAENWQRDSETGRFLYDAGIQVSLFHEVLNVYFPLLYSKVYRDYFKSTITESRFLRTISFSIDMRRLTFKRLLPQFSF